MRTARAASDAEVMWVAGGATLKDTYSFSPERRRGTHLRSKRPSPSPCSLGPGERLGCFHMNYGTQHIPHFAGRSPIVLKQRLGSLLLLAVLLNQLGRSALPLLHHDTANGHLSTHTHPQRQTSPFDTITVPAPFCLWPFPFFSYSSTGNREWERVHSVSHLHRASLACRKKACCYPLNPSSA